jgi:3-deoxy-manno-octulosonate cytidylyltransferase (CMP-KDO synthetase)
MVQWVFEQCQKARSVHEILVATDDERIVQAVERFGGQARMTSPECQSGTDRIAEIAERVQADIYVNVQGDEPMMDPRAIDEAVGLVSSGRFGMATAMAPLRDPSELSNPAVVKVVADKNGRALFFSRFPIPYSRKPAPDPGEPFACRRHVGLYAYDRETLFRFRALPPSALERAESLEQLRALEDGIAIGIAEVDFVSFGVDTSEELENVRKSLVRGGT